MCTLKYITIINDEVIKDANTSESASLLLCSVAIIDSFKFLKKDKYIILAYLYFTGAFSKFIVCSKIKTYN